MGKIALVTFLLALLAGTIWMSASLWVAEGAVEISGHVLFAMILGIIFSLAVGIGLMGLVFYSARNGYDEPAERARR
jgi:heme/copper-type cytochrome/quinol oxidase subunit 2